MQTWYTAATPYNIPAGSNRSTPVSISADPKTGSVLVQIQDSSGDWVTLPDDEGTITQFGIYQIIRENMPQTRILATLDAKFTINGV